MCLLVSSRRKNTTGNGNVANGYQSLINNTIGNNNTLQDYIHHIIIPVLIMSQLELLQACKHNRF
jgi:hypothetical protein